MFHLTLKSFNITQAYGQKEKVNCGKGKKNVERWFSPRSYFDASAKEIFWFDRTEGIWELNGEVLIRQTGTELLGKKTKQNYLNETIDYIKSKTYTDRKIFDNQNLNLMPLKNGVLNLETMKLMPYLLPHFLRFLDFLGRNQCSWWQTNG